jgi:DNA processing protein
MNDLPSIKQLPPSDAMYPLSLKQIFGELAAPPLSYMGNLKLLDDVGVGFCGSRKASDDGIAITTDIVEQLSFHNVVAVSGYAKGVDSAAHSAALSSNGKTVIVLPEGINHFRVRKNLEAVWDWERVLVISQFRDDFIWRADRAMERNKLIVGLSKAAIVVEAGETGGTINAGFFALKMKFPLLVVSFADDGGTRSGNRELLRLGAHQLNKSKTTGRAEVKPLLNFLFSKTKN